MWAPFLIKVFYVYIIGFLLAILEIQIEGKHGWAEKLPTWRPKEGSMLGSLWLRFLKKDLTGYHLTLMPLLFFFFHLPFVWGVGWTFLAEFEVIAFLVFFAVFWDFLWFVLNPEYSLKDFGPTQVWWHRTWWGKLPADYYIGTIITAALFIPAIVIDPFLGLIKVATLIGGITLLTLLTVRVYPKAF